MFSYVPYGALPFGGIEEADDYSVPDPIYNLLQGTGTLRYLVEVFPYSPSLETDIVLHPAPFGALPYGAIDSVLVGGVTTVYLSDHQFITEPEDDPANTYFFPLVDNPLSFDSSLIKGNDVGVNTQSYGSIEIANGAAELDTLSTYSFTGRRVLVKAGYTSDGLGESGPVYLYDGVDRIINGSDAVIDGYVEVYAGFSYDQYATVFDGLASAVSFDDIGVSITITDKSQLLDREIIVPVYDGSGGLDGNDDIAGRIKPIALGQCYNIEPVLVDPVNLIYQCHYRSMEAVDAVYDAGVELTFDSDVADITTATPAAGEYATSLDGGYIKLGSTPAGRITADVKGDNDTTYAESAPQICVRAALTLYGTLSFVADDIDNGFDDLHATMPWPSGIYITDKTTLRQIFDALLNPCLAYWYFTRFGRLSADVVDSGALSVTTLNEDNIDISGVEMINAIPPSWKITVAYAPVWSLQSEDEIAGGADEAHRTFVGNEYRLVTHEDRDLRTAHARPLERTFYTNIAEKTDAESLLERLINVYGLEKKLYRVECYNLNFRVSLGDVVTLDYPRYSISGDMTVMSIGEDAKSGKTTMELWG